MPYASSFIILSPAAGYHERGCRDAEREPWNPLPKKRAAVGVQLAWRSNHGRRYVRSLLGGISCNVQLVGVPGVSRPQDLNPHVTYLGPPGLGPARASRTGRSLLHL